MRNAAGVKLGAPMYHTPSMSSEQYKATNPNYQSPYASDPTSTSWRVANGLSPFRDGSGAVPSAAALAQADQDGGAVYPAGGPRRGAPMGGAAGAAGAAGSAGAAGGAPQGFGPQQQMLAQALRRMAAGSGMSAPGGFGAAQQTDMGGSAGWGPGVMGQMGGAAQSTGGGMQQADWRGMNRTMYPPVPGASGAAGGGFAGGRMYAGGSPTFDENVGLLGGARGMSPGMGAIPGTAGGMSFAPGMGAAAKPQISDPMLAFLSQYSQQ